MYEPSTPVEEAPEPVRVLNPIIIHPLHAPPVASPPVTVGQLASPPVTVGQRRPATAAHRNDGAYRFLWLMSILAFMVGVRYAVPRFAEEIQYSITRGRERAEYDQAKLRLTNTSLTGLSKAYQLVSQRVSPSVVHINVASTTRTSPVSNEGDEPELLFDFPRHHESGQGSGVIVDKAGYILTNLHVIRGANEIEVGLSNGRRVGAQVVGSDKLTDLAVLKVDAGDLIPAEWGDSDALEVGSLVWACGSPFGLQRTMTSGILSAKHRAGIAGTAYQDFLQTDAAVNPGNSGGPLVDEQGRIIGINTAIVGDAYQGVSFAVPSSVAKDVYQRLRHDGHVARGWLGVQMDEVTDKLADELGLPTPHGALVVNVVAENGRSPAADAGIQQGDVIVRWNDEEVVNPVTLSRLVAKTQIGTNARVMVVRSKAKFEVNIAVGERPLLD